MIGSREPRGRPRAEHGEHRPSALASPDEAAPSGIDNERDTLQRDLDRLRGDHAHFLPSPFGALGRATRFTLRRRPPAKATLTRESPMKRIARPTTSPTRSGT